MLVRLIEKERFTFSIVAQQFPRILLEKLPTSSPRWFLLQTHWRARSYSRTEGL
jgi:hypothetical protein